MYKNDNVTTRVLAGILHDARASVIGDDDGLTEQQRLRVAEAIWMKLGGMAHERGEEKRFDWLTNIAKHIYQGHCPDETNNYLRRDDNCPACRALIAFNEIRRMMDKSELSITNLFNTGESGDTHSPRSLLNYWTRERRGWYLLGFADVVDDVVDVGMRVGGHQVVPIFSMTIDGEPALYAMGVDDFSYCMVFGSETEAIAQGRRYVDGVENISFSADGRWEVVN